MFTYSEVKVSASIVVRRKTLSPLKLEVRLCGRTQICGAPNKPRNISRKQYLIPGLMIPDWPPLWRQLESWANHDPSHQAVGDVAFDINRHLILGIVSDRPRIA